MFFNTTLQWKSKVCGIWCRYLQIEVLAAETGAKCQCCFYSCSSWHDAHHVSFFYCQ